MVYYKLILNDKRLKADQIYPIVIRVTSNRISTTVSTGIRIHEKDWDSIKGIIRNTHPNWQVLNHQLLDFYSNVQRCIIKLQDERVFSFDALKRSLIEQSSTNHIPQSKISFNDSSHC